MNIEELRTYCLNKPEATESFPFDDVTLVFKVMGKIFAITRLYEENPSVNLKCDPSWAIELRETYPEVQPGYHMNKKHWNTVDIEKELPDEFLIKLIDHSYDRVVEKLPKAQRIALQKRL